MLLLITPPHPAQIHPHEVEPRSRVTMEASSIHSVGSARLMSVRCGEVVVWHPANRAFLSNVRQFVEA
jgi:hypothetical protein